MGGFTAGVRWWLGILADAKDRRPHVVVVVAGGCGGGGERPHVVYWWLALIVRHVLWSRQRRPSSPAQIEPSSSSPATRLSGRPASFRHAFYTDLHHLPTDLIHRRLSRSSPSSISRGAGSGLGRTVQWRMFRCGVLGGSIECRRCLHG